MRKLIIPCIIVQVVFNDVYMQISVSGMSVTNRFKSVFLFQFFDFLQKLRQFVSWNYRIFFFID